MAEDRNVPGIRKNGTEGMNRLWKGKMKVHGYDMDERTRRIFITERMKKRRAHNRTDISVQADVERLFMTSRNGA